MCFRAIWLDKNEALKPVYMALKFFKTCDKAM